MVNMKLVIVAALACMIMVCSVSSEAGEGTSGGNANGEKCVFPFIYLGVNYSKCSTIDNNGVPWCASTANYDEDKLWGNCVVSTYEGTGNANGAQCVFPFIYLGVSYSGCSTLHNNGVAWCATTANYDEDKLWGNCVVSTIEGNDYGAPCVFPFIYSGVSYDKCSTIDNNGVAWCATTANYDEDELWGNCIILTLAVQITDGGNANGAQCVFPFIYLGVSYGKCSTIDNNGIAWCATTPNYDNDNLWGNCIISTNGGNAEGAKCVFPFIYLNVSYSECSTIDNNEVACCATTANYDQDNLWGNCIVSTIRGNAMGAPCVFPFIYSGVSYDECSTIDNNGVAWCATTANYDEDELWGNCSW